MKQWILNKWDWWIYTRAFHSFDRIFKENPAYAYLFELHLKEYQKKHPISARMKKATKTFYDSLPK